jgi:hypothetical protein
VGRGVASGRAIATPAEAFRPAIVAGHGTIAAVAVHVGPAARPAERATRGSAVTAYSAIAFRTKPAAAFVALASAEPAAVFVAVAAFEPAALAARFAVIAAAIVALVAPAPAAVVIVAEPGRDLLFGPFKKSAFLAAAPMAVSVVAVVVPSAMLAARVASRVVSVICHFQSSKVPAAAAGGPAAMLICVRKTNG